MNQSISLTRVLVALFVAGCGGSESRSLVESAGTTSSVGGNVNVGGNAVGGSSGCKTGSERCDCYGNGTCNQGLECRSNLCVASSNGGNTSVGGNASSGGASSAGQASVGGNAGGGTTGVGGSGTSGGLGTGGTADVGGTTSIAGATGVGGTTGMGGTMNAGGTVANGGSGGIAIVGGTNSTGGAPQVGGTSGTRIATGGNPAVGGTTNTGGVPTATGGISSAGQSSTGGSTTASNCGNGIVDTAEGCDPSPHDNDLGDGCTPSCQLEPNCPAAGGPCTSTCGDGLVIGGEACDDGNRVNGDGCSADCQVETGYICSQPPLGDTIVVPMVVRDFDAGGDFEKGASFSAGLNYATQGVLQGSLDAKGLKPVLASTLGTYNGTTGRDSGIASMASFAQWYNDAAPASTNKYHATLASSLKLYLNKDGTAYVNRFGNNGDGANSSQYTRTRTNFCGYVGQEDHDAQGNPIPCTWCLFDSDTSTPQCDPAPESTYCQTDPTFVRCAQNGSSWSGIFLSAEFDGNPLFFPADTLKPASPSTTGQISGNYDPAWPNDPSGVLHNFSFTTEVRFWFTYDASKTYTLSFVGDDDVWVFINKKLAVDLGGIHTAVQGDLTIASGTGVATTSVTPTNVTGGPAGIVSHPDLGLQDGNIYEIAIFQAERQTKASSYMLSLAGFNTAPSICTPGN